MAKKSTPSAFHSLRDTWLHKQKKLQGKLVEKHKDILFNPKQYLLGGLMLANIPFFSIGPSFAQTKTVNAQEQPFVSHINEPQLIATLKQKLPVDVRPLTHAEEAIIGDTLSKSFHVKASAQLSGIRLNRSYGVIGKEQHLRRYPGDMIDEHFDTQEEAQLFASDGVAPGLGAWGYFAPSKQQFTYQDKMREKYYIAVQTFLAPGFNEHVGEYGIFFRYRKMLVVNAENGKGIIADIADAGPSPWTGKHLGGSPEVMNYLHRVDGAQKGPVLYFFVDDPHDTIPLGPISL